MQLTHPDKDVLLMLYNQKKALQQNFFWRVWA